MDFQLAAAVTQQVQCQPWYCCCYAAAQKPEPTFSVDRPEYSLCACDQSAVWALPKLLLLLLYILSPLSSSLPLLSSLLCVSLPQSGSATAVVAAVHIAATVWICYCCSCCCAHQLLSQLTILFSESSSSKHHVNFAARHYETLVCRLVNYKHR